MNRWTGAGLAGMALCVTLFTSIAAAHTENVVNVWVNGQKLQSDTAPILVENRVMVPLRALAEALGAEISWNGEQRSVNVTTPQGKQTNSLEQRVRLLEAAVAAQTPEEAVETWAKAVKTRNGALEYAMLSPALKQTQRASFEENHWVTGTSSPWVEQYRITPVGTNPDGSRTFNVQFDWRTSTNIDQPADWSQIPAVAVTVQQHDGFWYVSQLPEK